METTLPKLQKDIASESDFTCLKAEYEAQKEPIHFRKILTYVDSDASP